LLLLNALLYFTYISLANALMFRFHQVDHPAVFLLKDDAKKVVLFIGRLANPAQK